MRNFRFMYLTDTQFWDRTPENRRDDFKTACLRKMSEVIRIAKQRRCLFVLHGGDVFMNARPASFELMYKIFKKVVDSGLVWLFNVGNHGLVYFRHASYPYTGLGLLSLHPNVLILPHNRVMNLGSILARIKGTAVEDLDPHGMLSEVLIHAHWSGSGVDREGSPGWGYGEWKKYPRSFLIRMVHGMLLDARGPFGKEQTLLREINTQADIFLGSHYHPGWGPTRIDKTLFVNPGSLLRWPRPENDRKPKVVIFNVFMTEQPPWEVRHQLVYLKSAKPFEDVFVPKEDDPDGMNTKDRLQGIMDMMEHLPKEMSHRDPLAVKEAVLAMARKMRMDPGVRVKLLGVLDLAVREMEGGSG